MIHTHHTKRTVRSTIQSRNARWMEWQERRWPKSVRQQMHGMAEDGVEVSVSTIAAWRNGELPEKFLIDLIEVYPSLKGIFWREKQSVRAAVLLAKLDQMETEISNLRDLL